jgi:hypothetical protein
MSYLAHWIPTLAGAAVLAIAGFVLRAMNRRKDALPLPDPPRTRPETREGHTGS